MAQLWKGAVAACVFALGVGGAASAGGGQQDQQDQSSQREQKQDEAYGGSGEQGMQREQKQKSAELKGTVVDYKNKTAHLKLDNGAVVPVKITSRTQFEGGQQEQQGTGGAGQQGQEKQRQQKQAQEVQPGDELTATVTAQNGQNYAEKIKFGESKGKEEKLEGTVARASSNMLELDHDGAIIPLKVDKNTQFTGDVKSARELKEGDQVRASFRLENGTSNVATSIEAKGEKREKTK